MRVVELSTCTEELKRQAHSRKYVMHDRSAVSLRQWVSSCPSIVASYGPCDPAIHRSQMRRPMLPGAIEAPQQVANCCTSLLEKRTASWCITKNAPLWTTLHSSVLRTRRFGGGRHEHLRLTGRCGYRSRNTPTIYQWKNLSSGKNSEP